MAGASTEPSMEDILSSIKRIIAEDSTAALSGARVKRSVGLTPLSPPVTDEQLDEHSGELPEDASDVLELTDPVAFEAAPPAQTDAKSQEKPVTVPKAAVEHQNAPTPAAKPSLVSAQTAEASRTSLAALSALIIKPEVVGSDTLEGLVRAMLKPMLAEWLDSKLPEIVERQVAQEIARITARGA